MAAGGGCVASAWRLLVIRSLILAVCGIMEIREISGSYGGEYEDGCLLDYCAM
jgi:hypothetical protein